VTAAIFSLAGVVIGGVLTGIVQAVQQWRTERIETTAGARLLSAELSGQQSILEGYLAGELEGTPTLPAITEWPQYRSVMARALDDDAWMTVAGVYGRLAILGFAPDATSFEGLPAPQWMSMLDEQLFNARKSLQGLRGGRHRREAARPEETDNQLKE
jgi:hypothetical protein